MRRNPAVIAASAISMSLLSLAVFAGASTGSLGFDAGPATAATSVATTVQAPATAPTSAAKATATNPTPQNHEKERASDD